MGGILIFHSGGTHLKYRAATWSPCHDRKPTGQCECSEFHDRGFKLFQCLVFVPAVRTVFALAASNKILRLVCRLWFVGVETPWLGDLRICSVWMHSGAKFDSQPASGGCILIRRSSCGRCLETNNVILALCWFDVEYPLPWFFVG